jgi:hypothetical protein
LVYWYKGLDEKTADFIPNPDDPAADNRLSALYPICMKPSMAETVEGHITPQILRAA